MNVSNNASAIILENRVYVPAYLFRQANLTVQLNNNTLSLSENKTKYFKNLDILNSFRRGYMDYFEELDQETMNLLGHIILAEKVDTTVVLGLLDALTDNAKHTGIDSLSIIIDRPDGFSHTISCSESYSNALNNLLKYKDSGNKSDLKAFYSEREKSIESFNIVKSEFDRYMGLSLANRWSESSCKNPAIEKGRFTNRLVYLLALVKAEEHPCDPET